MAITALCLAAGALFVPTSVAPASAPYSSEWNYPYDYRVDAEEWRADAEFAALLKRDNAIDRVLLHEGGFAQHPADAGGQTKYGITRAEARRRGYSGRIQDLPLSRARGIYAAMWVESGAGFIEDHELAASAFDAYVAHGPRAKRWYAGLSGKKGCEEINAKRLSVYRGSKNWPVFGRGWAHRVEANAERCT